MIEALVGGLLLGAGVVYGYNRLTGCTGGHVYSEWEPVTRVRGVPYHDKDSLKLQREYQRHCTREGCTDEETEFRDESAEVYPDVTWNVTDVHYKCPECHSMVPTSERETDWKGCIHTGGRERWERCPECRQNKPSFLWERVPYEEVTE